jgi:hypothetical protein
MTCRECSVASSALVLGSKCLEAVTRFAQRNPDIVLVTAFMMDVCERPGLFLGYRAMSRRRFRAEAPAEKQPP